MRRKCQDPRDPEWLRKHLIRCTRPKGGAVREEECVPVGAMLDAWSDDLWSNGVQIDRLEEMEKLFVETANSTYEITVIDGPSGEIMVRGGRYFPELTPARLTGATLGGSFCKMRGIYTGFRMEINANGQRTVTTPVKSIGILSDTGKKVRSN